MYGIATSRLEYIDASATQRGAKCYATRHGYRAVYQRFGDSFHVEPVAYKLAGQWYALDDLRDHVPGLGVFRHPYDGRYTFNRYAQPCGEVLYHVYFCGGMLQEYKAETALEVIQIVNEIKNED